MSLQAILDAIRASGEAQIREMEARADLKVKEILANADVEARKAREEAFAKASAPAGAERARILHQAHLEGLHILGSAREETVRATLDQIRGRLAVTRTASSYPVVLRTLAEETLAEFDDSAAIGGQIELQADPRDQALLSRILSDLGLTLPVRYVLHCWGGLTARSEDGQIHVINTLEARLERATPNLRRFLAAEYEDENFQEESNLDAGEERLIV